MKKALIAMSGGVDSSVAAALTIKNGYEAEGVTLLTADGGDDTAIDDAKAVCDNLGIKHSVIDCRKEFDERVIKPFVASYLSGLTPNPCIICNPDLKFAVLNEAREKAGADILVTGHYAKTENADNVTYLCRGNDTAKDQSYFLYRLNQKILSAVSFPLGKYTKHEIREIAAEYGFSNAEKKDSQDICFLPDNAYGDFISEYTKADFSEGPFVFSDGRIIGKHRGVPRYTIGQRKGLGIAWECPLYVTGKDCETNTVFLGKEEDLYSESAILTNCVFARDCYAASPFSATVKTRYGKRETKAQIIPYPDGHAEIFFEERQRAVTPGQSAVFYDGNRVIGGGFIE